MATAASAAAEQARKIGTASVRVAVAVGRNVGQGVGLTFVAVVIVGLWASKGFPRLADDFRGRNRRQRQQAPGEEDTTNTAAEQVEAKTGRLANPFGLEPPRDITRGRETPDYAALGYRPVGAISIMTAQPSIADKSDGGDASDGAEEEWASAREEASVMGDGVGNKAETSAETLSPCAERTEASRALVEGWRHHVEDAYRGS